jgi:hypothetical protein
VTLAEKPLDWFLMDDGEAILTTMQQLKVPCSFVRSRYLTTSMSPVYSIALPVRRDSNVRVDLYSFSIALKVVKDKCTFKQEVQALQALFLNAGPSDPAPYAIRAYDCFDKHSTSYDLCDNAEEVLEGLLGEARVIVKHEQEKKEDGWGFDATAGIENGAIQKFGVIVMVHGMIDNIMDTMSKFRLTNARSLSNVLTGFQEDNSLEEHMSLYNCFRDVEKELTFAAGRSVSHGDLRPSNVVEFDCAVLAKVRASQTSIHSSHAHRTSGDAGGELVSSVTSSSSSSCIHKQRTRCWRLVDFGVASIGTHTVSINRKSCARTNNLPVCAIDDVLKSDSGAHASASLPPASMLEMFFASLLSWCVNNKLSFVNAETSMRGEERGSVESKKRPANSQTLGDDSTRKRTKLEGSSSNQ